MSQGSETNELGRPWWVRGTLGSPGLCTTSPWKGVGLCRPRAMLFFFQSRGRVRKPGPRAASPSCFVPRRIVHPWEHPQGERREPGLGQNSAHEGLYCRADPCPPGELMVIVGARELGHGEGKAQGLVDRG